nr:rRNA maturation RNase YbeY [Faunimonas pinastri]
MQPGQAAAGSEAEISIAVIVEDGEWPGEDHLIALAERAVRVALEVASPELDDESEVSILFTDDEAIRELNAQWREKDKATNVLSFPQAAGPLLGDIVLASQTVAREAAAEGKTLDDHITHLIVHGFLHLLGYDHEDEGEAEEMEGLERQALGLIGIADPYAVPPQDHE